MRKRSTQLPAGIWGGHCTSARRTHVTPSQPHIHPTPRLSQPHIHPKVFLLSTTAGGAGLNLVGANRLALLDR